MERYDNLDLECEASVTNRAAKFGGMFKKSFKRVAEPQEKGGVFKGVLGKSTKSGKEEMPGQEKTGVLGGILKRSPKPGHSRSESQDNFSMDGDLNGSSDSLSENNNTKEKGSKFGAMFKKSNWTKGANSQSQDDLSVSNLSSEKSGSSDNLSEGKDTTEKGGMFGGVFKKSLFTRPQSREDLTSDLSVSSDNLSEETYKASLSVQSSDFSVSSDSLNNNKKSSKEKPGMLGDILKQTPKAAHRRAESQDHLSLDGDLSNSNDSSSADNTKEKSSKFGGMFKGWTKGANSQSQENGPDSDDEEEKADPQSGNKQNKLTGAMMMLNPFRSANKYDKHTGSDEEPAGDEKTSSSKQNSVVGAMAKMKPFRSANKKDLGQAETNKEVEKQGEEKSKPVKSSPHPQERLDRSRAPSVPVKPAKKDNKNMALRQKDNVSESPSVPARPTEEELSRTSRHVLQKPNNENQNQSVDEVLTEFEEGRSIGEEDVKLSETKSAKMIKPKRHNPFLPPVADKAPSDDEGLKEDEPLNTEEGNAEEEGKGQAVTTKPKKTKKHNPFLPQVKVRPKRNPQDELTAVDDAAENEGGNRSLFDRLEDFRIDRDESNDQDVEGLMEWWSTVEQWEDLPQDDDMTEKEEVKAFALTAEKVQRGIRVFNKLFTERAESLWQHVIDLNAIADNLDRFNKKTKIAQITGGSTSAIGGVATIAGLALAPVTFGTSLIITAVGLGVATAGGLTSAGAGISNQVNNSLDRKKVEKIVEDYQEKMADINKCMTFIKQGIENLRKFDLLKMRKHAYNRDFPALNNIYEDGVMMGKAILINANEIMRVVQIANMAGSTAARAVQIASMATGVLTGLFVGMDIYFVAKDSKELKKGAKSEFAAKIREVAIQLHDGLVELNGIRDELQSTNGTDDAKANVDLTKIKEEEEEKKPEEEEDEDEIDRIKKAIKKDYENRDYV